MQNANRQIRLIARPEGLAGPEHFNETTEPVRQPDAGEVLVETLLLSIDPAMRVWMNEDPGYVPPIQLGSVMRAGGIARVVESRIDGLAPGDLVQGRLGWQTHPTLSGEGLHKLDLTMGDAEAWIGPARHQRTHCIFRHDGGGECETGRYGSGLRALRVPLGRLRPRSAP